MRLWKSTVGAGAIVAAMVAAGGGAAAQSAPVPITVFDSGFEPYTVYGRTEANGAVFVFDGALPAKLLSNSVAAPDLGPPLETAAGPAPSPPPAPKLAPAQVVPTPPAPAQPQATAQAPDSGDPAAGKRYVDGVYALNTDYWLGYPQNLYRIFSAPTRFDRSDWITTALVLGAGGALLLLDEPLMDFWQDDVRNDTTDDIASVFKEFGGPGIVFGTLGVYALAETLDSTGAVNAKREKSAAMLALQALILSGGIIEAGKYLVGRTRPINTDDALDFNGPSSGNNSFPSGHTGAAFAVASVVAETYGYDNPWVPWVSYGIATGTALSRVNAEKHWFSDVFLSAAIGYFVGTTITRYSPFLERNDITFVPFRQSGMNGVAVSHKF